MAHASHLIGLQWLHDGELRHLSYEVGEAGRRRLTLVLEAPNDMGYPEHPDWNGRLLRITCEDVLLFKWTAWGFTAGAEVLDAWGDAPPDTFSTDLQPVSDRGIRTAVAFAWTVSFTSGSRFLLLCDDVNVTVVQ